MTAVYHAVMANAQPHTMRHIAVVNDKGGVGKTTVTMLLAQALSEKGHKVLVHDLDASGSASAWAEAARQQDIPLPYDVANSAALSQALMSEQYDFVIIDTPTDAKAKQNMQNLARVSDIMLIPLRPGSLEIDRMDVTVKEIAKLQHKPDLLLGTILNSDQHTRLARETREYIDEEMKLPLVGVIPMRVGYQQAYGGLFANELMAPVTQMLVNLGLTEGENEGEAE